MEIKIYHYKFKDQASQIQLTTCEEGEKNPQDATIRCLLLTSVSTCFGHHYAHLQENKGPLLCSPEDGHNDA
jgi:hypothetical protein